MIRLYNEMTGEDRHIVILAHSQAASVVDRMRRYLPDQVADAIRVEAFAPATFIKPGGFRRVRNYVSDHDTLIMAACPIDFMRAKMGGLPNTEVLRGLGLCDHSWTGATYSRKIEQICRYYRGEISTLLGE